MLTHRETDLQTGALLWRELGVLCACSAIKAPPLSRNTPHFCHSSGWNLIKPQLCHLSLQWIPKSSGRVLKAPLTAAVCGFFLPYQHSNAVTMGNMFPEEEMENKNVLQTLRINLTSDKESRRTVKTVRHEFGVHSFSAAATPSITLSHHLRAYTLSRPCAESKCTTSRANMCVQMCPFADCGRHLRLFYFLLPFLGVSNKSDHSPLTSDTRRIFLSSLDILSQATKILLLPLPDALSKSSSATAIVLSL